MNNNETDTMAPTKSSIPDNGLRHASTAGFYIKTEAVDRQQEESWFEVCPSITIKTGAMFADEKEWMETSLIKNAINCAVLSMLKHEDGRLRENCLIAKTTVLNNRTNVLVTDLNRDVKNPNLPDGLSLRTTEETDSNSKSPGFRRTLSCTPQLDVTDNDTNALDRKSSVELENVGEKADASGLRSLGDSDITSEVSGLGTVHAHGSLACPEGELFTDVSSWSQSCQYQPVIRLERLPNLGDVSLGACTQPVTTKGTHRGLANRKKRIGNQISQRCSNGKRPIWQQSKTLQVKRSDDAQIQSSSVSTEKFTRHNDMCGGPLPPTDEVTDTEVYGGPLPPYDQDTVTSSRNCGGLSATDCFPQGHRRLTSTGDEVMTNLLNRENQKKLKMSRCWIPGKGTCSVKHNMTSKHGKCRKRQFACKICSKHCKTKAGLKSHLVTHSSSGERFVCKICGKRLTTKPGLVHHLRRHAGEKPFTCETCGKGFVCSSKLKTHSIVHTDYTSRPHVCQLCKRTFTTKSALNAHTSKFCRKTKASDSSRSGLYTDSGRRPYVCDVCQKGFLCPSHLKLHMVVHTNEKPYSCKRCPKSFKSPAALKTHILTHTGEKQFTCSICQKRFLNFGRLKIHVRIHTDDKPYSCHVCEKRFLTLANCQKHSLTHEGESRKTYQCESCNKTLYSVKSLREHKLIHTGEKPHTCPVCQKQFRLSGDLKKHSPIHSDEKPHVCGICQKSFKHVSYLRSHRKVHIDDKPYVCKVCQKCFRCSSNLRNHSRIHKGNTPGTCEVCQKDFNTASELRLHMRIHSGKRDFPCDICHEKFTKKYLKLHRLIHTGEKGKAYQCDVCQKRFIFKGTLTKHLLTHTGSKSYKCDICQKCVTSENFLKRHMRIHTGENPYSCSKCQASFSSNSLLKKHKAQHRREKNSH